ncbi:type III-A CRISPR-associated RAMP protein Csm4 [Luteithermobacter gelatinilyticus]|uniref:type III-A CRISPR-associated RAMP protein Csm4 n=1 Tax=Luteithermobacter gelatinilyticus TaxID=2582913 RepID=UPI0011060FC0|nr:CRISPR-associated protein Csm7 [Luteithermobacter gelatinilyticus]
MKWHRIMIRPQSAFGSSLKGDMLFGQLCWALRERFGEGRLNNLLEGYTTGRPFAVLSDAFPTGFLPRPTLPLSFWAETGAEDRKAEKAKNWIREEQLAFPINRARAEKVEIFESQPAFHNSINRETATTMGASFAPYQTEQSWPAKSLDSLSLFLLLEDERLAAEEFKQAFCDMGQVGFGRDASIGLGRFEVTAIEEATLPAPAQPNAVMTLAPCAPQGGNWQTEKCYYKSFVRFGRHGNRAALLGNAFKKPVLLADTAAVLTPSGEQMPAPFAGQGLGGRDNPLSAVMPETVHQGYAPVLPIQLEKEGGDQS